MGFTGAGGSLQRSLDTLVMTLPEMLRVLEAGRAQPKTALTRLGRGARPDEVEPQRTQPAEEEGEEDDDDELPSLPAATEETHASPEPPPRSAVFLPIMLATGTTLKDTRWSRAWPHSE